MIPPVASATFAGTRKGCPSVNARGAVLTVCEECYSQRESAEGGGLLDECPQCQADEFGAER